MRSRVDLPEPLRPTRQIRSPAATARPAPDRSGAAPKVRLMSCSESNGVGTLQPLALCLAPHGREPGLPLSRQAGRAVVMVQFDETGRSHVVAPGVRFPPAPARETSKHLIASGFDERMERLRHGFL